ncbi:MAG: insulinase family protein [Deltaproteobacteria bacterium]|nr:insulinase family protein [Deltaproteobacteria bacterium]
MKKVYQHTLPNGLKLIGECIPSAKSASIGYFVKTGSRDETAKEAGISHFLEHMMFKGTASRSALDIAFELGSLGAKSNAYTSEEATVYYGAVLPEYFAELQSLLSDMLRPALDSKEFDLEKKVILEEIALYEDRPHIYLFMQAFDEYFGSHPAGNNVLGSTASVSAITRDEMKNYFDRRYSPSNMVLVAAGNFNWDVFVSDAEKLCGHWQRFETSRNTDPYQGVQIKKTYTKKDINQSHVLLVAPGPSDQDDLRYPLGIYANIVGDSTGSRIYWELVDSGLAESADADCDGKDGTGCVLAYACTEPERLDQVTEILKRVLRESTDITQEELDRAKTKILTRMVLGGELSMGRMRALGHEWLIRERIHNLEEEIEKVKAISLTDIKSAQEQYPFDNWSEFRLIPE